MGLFGKLFGAGRDKVAKPAPPAPPAPPAGPERMITAYDVNGRELRIPLSSWRENVLKPAVEKAWNDADALAGQIVSALNDDCAQDVLEASAHLLDIDSDRERSYALRGVVLLQLGRPQDAKAALVQGLRKLGDRGVLLTNLAKAQWSLGEQVQGEETLWRALTADPNQENGLSWWLSIQRDRGQDVYVDALERVAALPDAWRPQLWKARRRLEQKDVPGAIGCYRLALERDPTPGDALVMASGDLGNAGHPDLIPELVAERYDPRIHGPNAGMNLLQAYLELGRWRDGEALVERLYRLNLAPYRPKLDHFAHAFREGLLKSEPPKPADPAELQVQYMALDLPVWCYRLEDPTWLLPAKPDTAETIMLMAFNRALAESAGVPTEQLEDEAGRLTRAIPLYLAESAWNWTSLKVLSLLPAVTGGGPVVFGGRAEGPTLWDNLPPEPRFLLTGEVSGDAGAWSVTVWLWERGAEKPVWSQSLNGASGALGDPVLALEKSFLDRISPEPSRPWTSFYARPPARLMGPYFDALSQALILTMAASDIVPKDSLWGERSLLEWPLRLHLDQPDLGQMEVSFISGLAKAKSYGSEILPEFEARALDLLKRAKPGSPARGLAPLVGRLLALTADALPTEAPDGDAYQGWLARVVADDVTPAG